METVGGERVIDALVRPVVVVLVDERVDRGLGVLDGGEHLPVQALALQALVEPLHLAGRGRRARFGVAGHDAVLPADPLEEHLTRTRPGEPSGELLAIVREHLTRHPEPGQRGGERGAHGAAGGPAHHRGDHAEPGVVVQAGDHLRLGAVGE